VAGAGAVWDSIVNTPWAVGQSQIGVYTIPAGKIGYLVGKTVFVDSAKTADVYFFQRPKADDVTGPYTGTMKLVQREVGVSGGYTHEMMPPKKGIKGPADVGFMATASAPSEVSVEFVLIIEDA
jgi:hypothetical protein